MIKLKQGPVAVIIFLVFFTILIFHSLLIPGNILFSTDDNLGAIALAKSKMPFSFIGWWADDVFFGLGGGRISLSWNAFWIYILPPQIFKNWYHALNLCGASFLLSLFLRERGLGLPAQIIGMLTAFWLGSNFTLIYAGHTLKYATMLLAVLSLLGIAHAIQQRSLAWSIVTGAVIGFMILNQQDVALFIGIFLAAFALYEFIRLEGLKIPALLARLAPILVCALLIAGPTLLTVYAANVGAAKDKSSGTGEESPRQKWEFATQWSWPPEECIDFIAPGYMGWRSGEPEGPYWGRMGRSAGWEKTGQGFMNFKLENQYLGAIPIFLALFAVFAAFSGRNSRLVDGNAGGVCSKDGHAQARSLHLKAEIYFWACAAIIALLLSFGKFFPLYALLYKLPLVNSIRNPNKFLHIFQIAVGILTAYGFDIITYSLLSHPRTLNISTAGRRSSDAESHR